MKKMHRNIPLITILLLMACTEASQKDGESKPINSGEFEIVKYNNPEATSFMGVGLCAWDYDGDVDLNIAVGIDDWTDYGWRNADELDSCVFERWTLF